eukprot:259441_1
MSQYDECNNNNCLALQRLIDLNNKYQKWLYDEIDKTNQLENVLHNYTMKHILRDYNHIKQSKCNTVSVDLQCSVFDTCIPMKRHKRDNKSQSQYVGNNIKQIIKQKILDQIHLYLFHPFTP